MALTREEVLAIGFKEIKTYTVTGAMEFDLGRDTSLSFGCVGTPNEMLFICYMGDKDHREKDDLVPIHNYDYDGYISMRKLMELISVLKRQ